MKAYKCDRCGCYYDLNDLPSSIPNITPAFREGIDLDLCPDCIRDFEEWLHRAYYYTEQIKTGHGIPVSQQTCGRCVHNKLTDDRKQRYCELGNEWRSTETICKQWEPDL